MGLAQATIKALAPAGLSGSFPARRSWLRCSSSPTSQRRLAQSDVYWRSSVEKKSRKERIEEIRREAANHPPIRRLRELAERGQAELEARRRGDAPSNS